ncbi:MAG: hypothetical protein U9R47_02960 [Actinomycetota bacterium]|nr:hypothetical protein [Actinomycetota bacterium]
MQQQTRGTVRYLYVALATVLLIGGCSTAESDAPATTTPPETTSTTTTMPVVSDPATSTTEDRGVVLTLAEPPDFDQIAEADGDIEACRAWAEWTYDEGPIDVALQAMAGCATLDWEKDEEYRLCIADYEPEEAECHPLGNGSGAIICRSPVVETCRAGAGLTE